MVPTGCGTRLKMEASVELLSETPKKIKMREGFLQREIQQLRMAQPPLTSEYSHTPATHRRGVADRQVAR